MNTPLERLEIANLVSFDIIGNSPEDGDWKGISPKWLGVARRSQKLLGSFLRKSGHKFRFYMIAHGEYSIPEPYRIFSYAEARKIIPEVIEDNSAVNVVFLGRGSHLERYGFPPTPWMIVHMMCHELYESRMHRMAIPLTYFDNMICKIYPGLNHTTNQSRLKIQYDMFTFRSARNNSIDNSDEGLIDFMTEIIKTGGNPKIKQNFPPTIYTSQQSFPNYIELDESSVDSAVDEFVSKTVQFVDKALREVKGGYMISGR